MPNCFASWPLLSLDCDFSCGILRKNVYFRVCLRKNAFQRNNQEMTFWRRDRLSHCFGGNLVERSVKLLLWREPSLRQQIGAQLYLRSSCRVHLNRRRLQRLQGRTIILSSLPFKEISEDHFNVSQGRTDICRRWRNRHVRSRRSLRTTSTSHKAGRTFAGAGTAGGMFMSLHTTECLS